MSHTRALLVPFLLLLAVRAFAQSAPGPAVVNPRVTCDRWPSNYDAKSWIADVWRISNAKSDEEKTIALYNWVRLQFHWGDSISDGTRGTQVVECDAIKKINIFPYGYCVDFGVTAAALGHAGGLKALEAHVPGHTELEVVYKDADGVERNHRLDPFWGTVVYDKTGQHIATWQEIKADPSVATNPSKTLLPWGDKKGDRARYADKGSCQPSLRVRPARYSMDKALYAGECYSLRWERQDVPFYSASAGEKDSVSWIRFQYAGTQLEKLAYGHESLLPHLEVQPTKNYGSQIQYRTGHGQLDFAPLLDAGFEDSLYQPSKNATSGGTGEPRLRPARAGAAAELVYAVRTPYVIADAEWTGNFRAGKDDSVKVSLAFADWRQREYTLDQVLPANPAWKVVWESKGDGPHALKLRAADLGLRGEYSYLVKVEIASAADPKKSGIDALKFSHTLQQSHLALPRLLPGKNVISVNAESLRPGCKLRVTYAWDDAQGADRRDVKIVEKFPFSYEITAAGQKPADVRTRFVNLEAVTR